MLHRQKGLAEPGADQANKFSQNSELEFKKQPPKNQKKTLKTLKKTQNNLKRQPKQKTHTEASSSLRGLKLLLI